MIRNRYMIQVYTSFVTARYVYIKGRVLKNRSPVSFENQGPISSLFNTILRARSEEIPNTPVTCVFGSHTFEVFTDDEGYIEVFHNITTFSDIPKKVTFKAEVKNELITFEQKLRRYQYDVPYGIITDVDDTILVTKVRSFFRLKLLFNTVFVNPFRRKPIENAAEALHSLLSRSEGQNPIIYLSNSPWNIYDYLQTFLLHNAFPIGELILRDMGMQLLKSREIHEYNKFIEIEKLLIAFGDTKFTLIGDTGELDFDIYKAIMEKYPERIERIILKKEGNQKKQSEINRYIDQLKHKNILLVDDYSEIDNFSKVNQ